MSTHVEIEVAWEEPRESFSSVKQKFEDACEKYGADMSDYWMGPNGWPIFRLISNREALQIILRELWSDDEEEIEDALNCQE